jgi:hypothetical protein
MENPGANLAPPPRATYADRVAADELLIAELIAGKLYTSRRLPPLLSIACVVLFVMLAFPFEDKRQRGPGGWRFLKAIPNCEGLGQADHWSMGARVLPGLSLGAAAQANHRDGEFERAGAMQRSRKRDARESRDLPSRSA